MIDIRQCKIFDLVNSPNFKSILDAYHNECAMPEFGKANPKMDVYYSAEHFGKLLVIGAFCGENLAGMLIIVVTEIPHFNCMTATTESFFVDHAYRKNGTGKKMLAFAEKLATQMGAKGLFMSAVSNSRLEKAAPLFGFRKTNTQFFKVLN